MTVEVVVNNYVLGAKVKTTPTHKLTECRRLDSSHTLLVYTDICDREKEFIEKVLSCKVDVID